MWSATRVSDRLRIRYPIIQGPFGNGPSSPALVAAVSNAGGLGSYGAVQMSPEEIGEVTAQIRALTNQPFAINLWVPLPGEVEATLSPAEFEQHSARLRGYYDEVGAPLPAFTTSYSKHSFEQLAEAVVALAPPAFSFIYGVPDAAIIAECRQRGIVTLGTATNVDEAVALDDAGLDLIVASGTEAGGHRASFLRPPDESPGLMALIPQTVDRVRAPVIAAGGIADGRGIAAALALGAQGVQIGTAFLVCAQSNAKPLHRAALRSPQARYTTLTRAFTGRFARSIRNRFIDELRSQEALLPPYPVQSLLTSGLRQAAVRAERADLTSLWCGQSAALATHDDASALMRHLIADTERVLISMSRT